MLTLHSTALDHQMPLPGGYISSEILNTLLVWVLHHTGLFYERPMSAWEIHSKWGLYLYTKYLVMED